jgi:hypothetical protein
VRIRAALLAPARAALCALRPFLRPKSNAFHGFEKNGEKKLNRILLSGGYYVFCMALF